MLHTMQLMPIGRFSRLTGVGVKALRHYDEVGLLVPAAVDDETGYRFYSVDRSTGRRRSVC
jgi:DNA-binding transcriptional MerR regulator